MRIRNNDVREAFYQVHVSGFGGSEFAAVGCAAWRVCCPCSAGIIITTPDPSCHGSASSGAYVSHRPSPLRFPE
jgi:hypothetical protein